MRIFSVSSHERPPTLTTAPDCTPAKGEILVRNLACGLNFADLLMMRGKYQDTPALPFTLGMEVAGVVETLGPDTDGPAPGTRVAVFGGSGGLADLGTYPADRTVPLPDAVDDITAAALQIAYGTSHVGWGLNRRARYEALSMYDQRDINGTELRAFAGNFLWSTGANETAGRYCRGHFDLPMRNCTVALDGEPVVEDGVLVGDPA